MFLAGCVRRREIARCKEDIDSVERSGYFSSMDSGSQITLIVLQAFQVAFLWFHDWIPLGRLNDVAAVRREDSLQRLMTVTLIQSVPWTVGLVASGWYFGQPYPGWVRHWLWITYTILFLGQLRAWWIPYLFLPDPERAARYEKMFGNTHAFLPQRHGMVPNTLHVLLHLFTLVTLIILFMSKQFAW